MKSNIIQFINMKKVIIFLIASLAFFNLISFEVAIGYLIKHYQKCKLSKRLHLHYHLGNMCLFNQR